MDKLTRYRSIIKTILEEQAQYKPAHGEIEPLLVNDKLWLEYNGTDSYIARQLVAAGVPKEEIVLAFHPPKKRPYTDYAVL